MATYNESLGGYVADVPRVVFRRCDKKAIYLDELSAATVSANIETTDINGGWSLFPVAVLPGSSTFTMNFTSAKFESELFSITNKTDFVKNSNYQLPTGERHEIDANHQITLLNAPVAGTVYIRGMEETTETTVAAGTYKVDAETKKITFSADDDMDYVDVVYDYVKEVQEAIITNKESAIGEATASNYGFAA